MGLFGGLLKGIAGAVVPALGSALGASGNSKAIKKANAAQQAAIAAAQQQFQQTYGEAKTNFNPYIAGGLEASDQTNRLLGIGDHLTGTASNPLSAQQQQTGALAALKDSPLFKSVFNTGQEAVLQNAAATGGVRGGNVQNALAENGENTFASVLQNYLAQLGGVAGQGLSASSGLANLGANNAQSLGNLFQASGASNAGAILGQQNVQNQLQQQITQQLSSAFAGFGGGGTAAGLGGSSGGVNNIASVLNQGQGSVFTRGF